MKILAFTDLHGDLDALRMIKHQVRKENIKLILCGGDMTVFGHNLLPIMKKISELGAPVLTIHGNHEYPEDVKLAASKFKKIIDLNKKIYRTNGYVFLGYGDGGFSLTLPDFRTSIEKLMKNVKKDEKVIFLLHPPPYGTKCDLKYEGYVGTKTITSVIKKFQPQLVLCGHIHEGEGQTDKIGKSIIINAGHEGKIIEI